MTRSSTTKKGKSQPTEKPSQEPLELMTRNQLMEELTAHTDVAPYYGAIKCLRRKLSASRLLDPVARAHTPANNHESWRTVVFSDGTMGGCSDMDQTCPAGYNEKNRSLSASQLGALKSGVETTNLVATANLLLWRLGWNIMESITGLYALTGNAAQQMWVNQVL
jgi:hypothetical protein